jgi:hypothetical protein
MSRHQEIVKLAQETLTDFERHKLNTVLSFAQGYDFIDSILNDRGFNRGPELKKNIFLLRRGGEKIGNCVLKGDYQGMQIVPIRNVPEKKYHIPRDAYHSSSAIYEQLEKDNENDYTY